MEAFIYWYAKWQRQNADAFNNVLHTDAEHIKSSLFGERIAGDVSYRKPS